MINVPYISRVYCKFSMPDYMMDIDFVVRTLCFRKPSDRTAKTAPKYIRGTARASTNMFKLFEMFVTSDLITLGSVETSENPSLYDSFK